MTRSIPSLLYTRESILYPNFLRPEFPFQTYHLTEISVCHKFPAESLSPEFWGLNNQFSSVAQSCLTLCESMGCSMPGLHHQLPEFTQTHLHWVSDTTQPSHPRSSPSPPTFNLSQRQGLFKWVSSSHQVAKVLEFQLQHQSFQWILRIDLL